MILVTFLSKVGQLKSHPAPWHHSKTSIYSAQRSCTSRHAHSGHTPGHHNPWRKRSHHNYLSITAVSSDSYSKYDMKVNPSQPQLQSNQYFQISRQFGELWDFIQHMKSVIVYHTLQLALCKEETFPKVKLRPSS